MKPGPKPKPATLERVMAKVLKLSCGCWIFLGTTSGGGGYGQVNWQGLRWYVHVLVWTLLHGPVPKGMKVCHTCDQPACCRPKHLFLGTQKENMEDCAAKGRVHAHWRGKKLSEAHKASIAASLKERQRGLPQE
jgi:hypothetical protein